MGDGGLITIDPAGGPPQLRQLVGRIVADPEHHTVVKGSKVKYRFVLESRDAELKLYWDDQPAPAPSPAVEQFDKTGRTEHPIPWEILDKLPADPKTADIAPMLGWIAIYDKQAKGPAYEIVGRSTSEVEVTWRYPGQHIIVARIAYFAEDAWKSHRELAETHIIFTQRVAHDVQTVQKRRLTFARGKPPPHPLEELDAMERYVEAIEAAEREHGVPKHKEQQYRRELQQKRKYRDALHDMFDHYRRRHASLVPAVASYAAKDTSEQAELRICVEHSFSVGDAQARVEVTLIDWTNPLDNRLRGRYTGSGPDQPSAIQAAVNKWRENCQYYHPGNVVGEVPALHFIRREPPPPPVKFAFDTPGKDFWDHLKDFLEALGLLVATVALVITIITPIPGDEIIAGLIWTSIFASVTASTISIGRRKRNGFEDGSEDVFDVLTIVGNVFTAGRLGWARRAMLVSKAFGGRFKQFALFGEVATDALQGLLIAKEKIAEFEQILSDPNLSPKERVDKMLELVRSAMVTGALHYTSVRGAKRPARHGERPETFIDPPTRKRLENPREVIDLDALRKQKGDAAQGELKTKVQDEPQRAKAPPSPQTPRPRPKKRGKFDFTPAPHPHKRGMRAQDDFDFEEQALAKDHILLVRDSNEAMLRHVNDPRKGPKPELLKAKTLKQGKSEGLASADPNDPRLKEMLAAMKSPSTGEAPMSYEEFVADLESHGFKIRGRDGDYVVYNNEHPDGFYSDYDLHGIYDKQGRGAYSEKIRGELNERFGKDLVQHGPHDEWPKRNSPEAGPNRGPQPPVTAYVPVNGEVKKFHLTTIDDMKDFYEAWNIPWKRIYPEN